MHSPVWQGSPTPHFVPHAPQLLTSVFVSTHFPPQLIKVPTQAHLPPKQARPLAVSQVMPQAPQFALSECGSTHAPLHVCFGGQQPETHLAASQNVQGSGSTPHVLPHAPQLFGSVARLTHFVLHAV
jgi:hypothetical protein